VFRMAVPPGALVGSVSMDTVVAGAFREPDTGWAGTRCAMVSQGWDVSGGSLNGRGGTAGLAAGWMPWLCALCADCW